MDNFSLISQLSALKVTEDQLRLANNLTEDAPLIRRFPFAPSNRGEHHDYATLTEVDGRVRRGFGQGYENRSSKRKFPVLNLENFSFSVFVSNDFHERTQRMGGNINKWIEDQLNVYAGEDGAETEFDFVTQMLQYAKNNNGTTLGGYTVVSEKDAVGGTEEILIVNASVNPNARGAIGGVFNGSVGQAVNSGGGAMFKIRNAGSIQSLQEFADQLDSNGAAIPGYKIYADYQVGLLLNNPRAIFRIKNVDSDAANVTTTDISEALRRIESQRPNTRSFVVAKPELIANLFDADKIEKIRYRSVGDNNVETEIEMFGRAEIINSRNVPTSAQVG